MAIPDFQSLMLPVLDAAKNGEVKIGDVVEKLADDMQLTVDERSHLLPSGRQTTFANRVHWAKSYLKKAGLVRITRRAYFEITEEGLKALNSSPAKIDIEFLSRYSDFQQFREYSNRNSYSQSLNDAEETNDSLTPDEQIRKAAQSLNRELAIELLAKIREGTPTFFEKLVIRLLHSMGYGGSVLEIDKALVGGAGDGGIDGVIDQDPLGLDRIYIQAKRYGEGNNIGSGAIRDFFGSLDRFKASKGLFVTTSAFSNSAKETAELLSKRIVLIDGLQLAKLMIKHEVGCRVEEVIQLKKIDEDFFE
ncbi:restriction endonuclease [Terasakiella brassicae]|uniref:Restriction endonuclease n=1 Tax=Terasakiella brassicae TaxID=1634917 RepID=A0A917FCR4_9PROT|nr:restriction endonuclease [Terasakiella brassicae]GGF71016.1 restriction endonuclease [Terasakiella brassicae]